MYDSKNHVPIQLKEEKQQKQKKQQQLFKDAIAYTSVLDAWASSGRCEKALETFQDMKRRKLEVNALSYNAIWQRKWIGDS